MSADYVRQLQSPLICLRGSVVERPFGKSSLCRLLFYSWTSSFVIVIIMLLVFEGHATPQYECGIMQCNCTLFYVECVRVPYTNLTINIPCASYAFLISGE